METQLLDFGLRMECIGDTGRNLVAVKAFQAGETVLQNEPLFSWDNASMEDYIIKYIESSPEIQEQVMGMEYHEDESADSRYSDLHRIAESLAERISGNYAISPAMVYKLLQIKRTNAHAYSSSGRQSRGALFRLASKCNHSCAPNVMYSSLDGLMQFTALSNIEIGDVIYASYLTDLLVTPYADRQKKLMDTKDFQCRCRRCLSTDDCCGLRCLTSTKTRSLGIKCQKGVAYRRNSDAIWVCSTCNAESTDDDMCLALSAVQVGLVEKFAELERKFIAATDPMSPNDFTNVIEEVCRIGFTKRHYLVLKTQRLYVKWCQGQSVELTANGLQADAQCTSPWGELCSAMGFLMTAVNESLSLIQQLECIGSSCSTENCEICHPAHSDCCIDVYYCLSNCLQLVQYAKKRAARLGSKRIGICDVNVSDRLVAQVAVLGRKYLRLLFAQFGSNDIDVLRLKSDLLTISNCHNPDCYMISTIGAAVAPLPLKKCARCSLAQYCCRECQVYHFKISHKRVCKQVNK